jgi:hypothetical protein
VVLLCLFAVVLFFLVLVQLADFLFFRLFFLGVFLVFLFLLIFFVGVLGFVFVLSCLVLSLW